MPLDGKQYVSRMSASGLALLKNMAFVARSNVRVGGSLRLGHQGALPMRKGTARYLTSYRVFPILALLQSEALGRVL